MTPKEKALKEYELHIKHQTVTPRIATEYAIDIAIQERDKQWEDAIDKCTLDGSVKIIKNN